MHGITPHFLDITLDLTSLTILNIQDTWNGVRKTVAILTATNLRFKAVYNDAVTCYNHTASATMSEQE
jgi:hypothetical protein